MPAPTPLVSVRAKRASPVTASPPAIAIPPAETAHVLSVSLSKVYDLMRKGELSSYRDGRSRRVLMSSIHEYVARRVADTDNGGWQTWEHNPQARRGRQVKEHA